MPDAEPDAPTAVERPGIPCRHLRHQGMYVYTDGQARDPDQDYDTTIHWCLKTMKGYGPDDDLVERRDCCDPTRSCYEPL